MSKILCCIAAVLMINCGQYTTLAQVLPKDGDTLNYRLIGFSFPEHKKATEYLLEVEEFNLHDDGTFDAELVQTQKSTSNRIITTVPKFGRVYRWHIKYLRRGKIIDSTQHYYFNILDNIFANQSYRVRIIDSASAYQDMFVFFDNTQSLYNMQGDPVWFLPYIPGVTDSTNGTIRDLKITEDGTITFMTYKNVFEIDWDGNVLWRGPNNGKVSGDSVELYHHNFTKLKNGHYMVIGNIATTRDIPEFAKKYMPKNKSKEINTHPKITDVKCGTLIEYDKDGNVIWKWNSCDYLNDKDLYTPLPDSSLRPSIHFNSFHFDEQNNVIYTSYRDMSRITKISYPSGEVLAVYGDNYANADIQGDGLFYAQHSVTVNKDGNIVLFNNNNPIRLGNDSNKNRVSSVIELKESMTNDETLKKIWEFGCDIDTLAPFFSPGGGGIYELNKGDYLVCMGAIGRNFIVSDNKKILWNVLIEKYLGNNTWKQSSGYRISPVAPEQIEKIHYNNIKKR
jgi:hypothetical protein